MLNNKFIDYIKDGSFFWLTQHACLIVFIYYMLNSASLFLKAQFNIDTISQTPKEIIKYNTIVLDFLEKYTLFILFIAISLLIIGITLTCIKHIIEFTIIYKYAGGSLDAGIWLSSLVIIHYTYTFLQAKFIIITFFIALLIGLAYQENWYNKIKENFYQ